MGEVTQFVQHPTEAGLSSYLNSPMNSLLIKEHILSIGRHFFDTHSTIPIVELHGLGYVVEYHKFKKQSGELDYYRVRVSISEGGKTDGKTQ